jgi:hypothetical protein
VRLFKAVSILIPLAETSLIWILAIIKLLEEILLTQLICPTGGVELVDAVTY